MRLSIVSRFIFLMPVIAMTTILSLSMRQNLTQSYTETSMSAHPEAALIIKTHEENIRLRRAALASSGSTVLKHKGGHLMKSIR
jgi:hypothetical protein